MSNSRISCSVYGGRITLINSVLSSIPLYFFSFFKAPSCILNQLVRIQRNFLWGGGIEDKKLCWVRWDQICLPKDQGGLGVKNLEVFNGALLSKWKWRFLVDGEAVWSDLLKFRYGHLPSSLLCGAPNTIGIKESLWWKDILSIGGQGQADWFKSHVRCEAFQDAMISDKLEWNGGTHRWIWHWRDPLSEIENVQLLDLMNLLTGLSLQPDGVDKWRWTPESGGIFSVKSCYNLLIEARNTVISDANVLGAIQKLWKNDVPFKIVPIYSSIVLLSKRYGKRYLGSTRKITLNAFVYSAVHSDSQQKPPCKITEQSIEVPSPMKAITRVPAPLVEEARAHGHTPDKPLPRNPFDALRYFFRINNTAVKHSMIPRPPNRPNKRMSNHAQPFRLFFPHSTTD
ncbi:hypothetical protein TSUD_286670 [Trifolium subterraneum]|uniref:Reverse transcriptase zinc-binding domain-containing protein n=1 Tax=Trifolium subterraneum TaxID=3900 RepID=A0A2Z6MWS2_TRISU|nr:hypothetical protein TSUD_286670 [Trifolium subterraneum]